MDIACTCSALRMAARRLSQAYDVALAPAGLSVSQYAVLSNLARRGAEAPPTVGDLAGRLGLDRTTLAHNLRPLERDGLVVVLADPSDKRIRRVALTAEGCARRDQSEPLWRAAQDRFEREFGAEAARTLRASLMTIAGRADDVPASVMEGN